MNVADTPLAGLKIVTSAPYQDSRGAFLRLFCERELRSLLGDRQIAQINFSMTKMTGTVRGLHFQYPPHAELKMVRCLHGRVWDIAVDLREGSSTFLQWHAQELTPGGAEMMVIPEGFAHGFQTLEPNSELLYLHTNFYDQTSEAGVRHDDPKLAIAWPLTALDLSPRDLSHPLLNDDFIGVTL